MSIKRCWCFIVVAVCLFRNETAAMPSCDVLVVGGGAAGMMAALQAAWAGAQVVLLEKNEKLGKNQFLVPYLMSSHPGCTLEDEPEEFEEDEEGQTAQKRSAHALPARRQTPGSHRAAAG